MSTENSSGLFAGDAGPGTSAQKLLGKRQKNFTIPAIAFL
jgi:hypothetical protein